MENPTLEGVEQELQQVEADVAVLKQQEAAAQTASPAEQTVAETAAPQPPVDPSVIIAQPADVTAPAAQPAAPATDTPAAPVQTEPVTEDPTPAAAPAFASPAEATTTVLATEQTASPAAETTAVTDPAPTADAAVQPDRVSGAPDTVATPLEAPTAEAEPAPQEEAPAVTPAAAVSTAPDFVQHAPAAAQVADGTSPDHVNGPAPAVYSNYRKKNVQPMRPYIPGEDLTGVSVSSEDTPEEGGMIAMNPANPADKWYVAKQFFLDNYIPA